MTDMSILAVMLVCSVGHGLQWLWPYIIAYEPGRTAVLDDVCVVLPRDELQQAPKGSPETAVVNPFVWLMSKTVGWSSSTNVHEQPQVHHSGMCTAFELKACVAR